MFDCNMFDLTNEFFVLSKNKFQRTLVRESGIELNGWFFSVIGGIKNTSSTSLECYATKYCCKAHLRLKRDS